MKSSVIQQLEEEKEQLQKAFEEISSTYRGKLAKVNNQIFLQKQAELKEDIGKCFVRRSEWYNNTKLTNLGNIYQKIVDVHCGNSNEEDIHYILMRADKDEYGEITIVLVVETLKEYKQEEVYYEPISSDLFKQEFKKLVDELIAKVN